jgi:hypothetical protein
MARGHLFFDNRDLGSESVEAADSVGGGRIGALDEKGICGTI